MKVRVSLSRANRVYIELRLTYHKRIPKNICEGKIQKYKSRYMTYLNIRKTHVVLDSLSGNKMKWEMRIISSKDSQSIITKKKETTSWIIFNTEQNKKQFFNIFAAKALYQSDSIRTLLNLGNIKKMYAALYFHNVKLLG